ncbi:MAG: DUF6498-containing protein [Dehalococcoidia bacterium]|jgi:hypothetical protein
MAGNRFLRFDISTKVLMLANVVTILFAVVQKWDVIEVMWVYWAQSVIIGCFTYRRILDLKYFSTKGMSVNGVPLEPTQEAKRQTAKFFLVHYGFFHLAYFLFLLVLSTPVSVISAISITVCILTFLANHWFSYKKNRLSDMNRTLKLGTVFMTPYVRIIPMHLTIILGGVFIIEGSTSTLALLLFLILKTFADVIMHMVEHRSRRPEGETGSL